MTGTYGKTLWLPALGRHKVRVLARDSECDIKSSAGLAVDLVFNESVDVIIGPPCSSALRLSAELASFFNVPIISWVGTDPDLNDKITYSTLSRTLGPLSKLGDFLLSIFEQYKWRRVAIVASNWLLWQDAGKALKKTFTESNVTIAMMVTYERKPPRRFIVDTLEKIQREARIVLVAAPKEDRRRFILHAYDLGMCGGDYVFYTIDMLPDEEVLNPESVWKGNDGRDAEGMEAFQAVFHVTLAALTGKEVDDFRVEVARRMKLPPWNVSLHFDSKSDYTSFQQGDKYSPFLYDAVILYAMALGDTMRNGQDVRDGSLVVQNMKGRVFKGMSGNVVLDSNGDREPDFWIMDMDPSTGMFIKIAEILNTDRGVRDFRKNIAPPRWPGGKVGHEHAPPDTPVCGFRNEYCQSGEIAPYAIVLTAICGVLVVSGIVGVAVLLYRRSKLEKQFLLRSWSIKMDEIEILKSKTQRTDIDFSVASGSSGDMDSSNNSSSLTNSQQLSKSGVLSVGGLTQQIFTDIGLYKGVYVSTKQIKKDHFQVTRSVLVEFAQLRNLAHDNLNVFAGACIEPPNFVLVWHYCSKGSIQDVIMNDSVKLDKMFKISFMTDITKGMIYLHNSKLHSHGNLKSSNCLVDSRWNVKVTDYGLPSVIAQQNYEETLHETYQRKVWTAPEILRENFPGTRGSQKGDVYSFAIICYEIMMRSEPYNYDNMTPRDVVNRVRNGESIPFRPQLPPSTDLGTSMLDLIKVSWRENPESRPGFYSIKSSLKKMAGGDINIINNILRMMEQYTNNLEEIVEERTQQVMEEKKKTDRLLCRLLPPTVAESLKSGTAVKPENYEQCTIYFSDIVGFTNIASNSNPMQIIDFLNDLYSKFDEIIFKHDVYKVETIGDAYMIVSGVPVRNGNRHAAEIANCALDLLGTVKGYTIKHRPNQKLLIRVGLHTGPVVAGVVGLIMPRYCLFGDTVNMATTMEAAGKPMCIHISEPCYNALRNLGGFELGPRGDINIKGKGFVSTFWIHGHKDGDTKYDPEYNGQNETGVRRETGLELQSIPSDDVKNLENMPPGRSPKISVSAVIEAPLLCDSDKATPSVQGNETHQTTF